MTRKNTQNKILSMLLLTELSPALSLCALRLLRVLTWATGPSAELSVGADLRHILLERFYTNIESFFSPFKGNAMQHN